MAAGQTRLQRAVKGCLRPLSSHNESCWSAALDFAVRLSTANTTATSQSMRPVWPAVDSLGCRPHLRTSSGRHKSPPHQREKHFMTKHLYRLGMVLAMSAGFALAQSTATPSSTPKTFPDQTQTPSAQQSPATTQPSSSDQMPSSTSQAPSSSSTTPATPSTSSSDQSTSPAATSSPQTDQSASPSSSPPSASSGSQSTAPSSSNSSSQSPSSSSGAQGSSSASGMPQSDMGASSDVQSKIQSALQQNPNLSGVSVNATDKGIELTGNASSGKDRKEAVRIAKENAGGKKVIDHIQVGAATSSNPK